MNNFTWCIKLVKQDYIYTVLTNVHLLYIKVLMKGYINHSNIKCNIY